MNYIDPLAVLSRLSERDLAVIDDIENFRLLTTRLIQRSHFPAGDGQHASTDSATRQTMRVLSRLAEHGVIRHLERRIGGVRHGSQGYIWQLTSTGANLQRTRRGETTKRRYIEPSTLFTDHTLAIAELGVTIRELADGGALEILRLQTEPDCWREYVGPHGAPLTVKPDLHIVTATPEFEDHLFLEADLGSEHMPQILAKCRAYASYHATGIEQHQRGVFPAVLWVVQNEARAGQLRRAIRTDTALPQELFTVVTRAEFAGHLIGVKDPPSEPAATSSINSSPRKEEPPHGTSP